MKKKIILLEVGLLLPCLAIIINSRLSVDVLNGILILFGFNIHESHLTIGEWLLVAYLFLLPTVQFLFLVISKPNVDLDPAGKVTMWLATLMTSAFAWYMYTEGIVLLK